MQVFFAIIGFPYKRKLSIPTTTTLWKSYSVIVSVKIMSRDDPIIGEDREPQDEDDRDDDDDDDGDGDGNGESPEEAEERFLNRARDHRHRRAWCVSFDESNRPGGLEIHRGGVLGFRENIDAIVHPVGGDLTGSTGISSDILQAGGAEVTAALRELAAQLQGGSAEPGDSFLTTAGTMENFGHIIHTVGPLERSYEGFKLRNSPDLQ